MILFLAANPRGTDALALDREARAIHHELRRSGYRDRFEFVTRWAAEPLDLLRELRELKPTVVHVSGHGVAPSPEASGSATLRDVVVPTASEDEPRGLILHDAAGSARIVPGDAVAQAFEAAGASVKLVVLNACFTEPIAEALLANVDCVVGMSGAIHDDAARVFAIGFYGGLGEHESVAAAYAHGRAAIQLEGLPDAARPRLKVRDGCDATAIILAAVAPVVRQVLPCPYPGMRPYTADDADRFHGRAKEIRDLLGRLRAGEREIYVIGPSGSGKSSLVTAGALRQLARGGSGLAPFVVRDLRPGEQPATRLGEVLGAPPGQPWVAADRIAALLAHRAPSSSVLLLIDQLEELFTLSSAEERTRFLAALRDLRGVPRCVVIFTLRADFFGALMESPLWTEHQGEPSLLKVSPLHGEMLRDAIASPARDLGVVVEPELIERLLADAAAEPGILPLLQETLVQLWDQRQDQTLTLEDYQALGDGERSGLAIALAHRADAALRPLTPALNAIARRILLRLISFGEGRSDTRRQQPRSRLLDAADHAADFAYVLQQLIDHRLLTSDKGNENGEPLIDLGHEIMISAWPTFADWIRAHRVDEQRRRQFEEAAVQHGRGARGLLDPIELAEAENWQRTESAGRLGQSAAVTALIAASRAAQTKQRRRRRLIGGAVGLLGLAAVAVAATALAARDQANKARRLANYAQEQRLRAEASDHKNQELVAQSYAEAGRQLVVDRRYQEATPYLLAARQSGEDRAPLRMMFWEAEQHLPLTSLLGHQKTIVCVAFSPDGTRVVTASLDKTARVWDAATGKPLTSPLEHQELVSSTAFSPDGTRVVTASHDKTARVWDAATGKPLTRPLEHQNSVVSVAFSSEGTHVVTASVDKTARMWDVATGKLLTSPLDIQEPGESAAFSSDGTRVVTASVDKIARVWEATGQPLTRPLEHQKPVRSAAFSPDGTRVVTASEDHTARVWSAATGKPLTSLLGHGSWVVHAAFSPDGTRVVTASWDHTARVWDAATGKLLTSPLEHQEDVWSTAFSP
ncbi:MAG TPA: CHAT domain-containing protein, partial [Kofleriaceae bacterium]